ncbi:MAG: hypothetical protein ACLSUZ_08370, partial [Bifidobacterium pseudocatenulatum]
TIPSRVGNDVTADDGVAVSSDNTSTLVAAAGKPGEDLTFNTYVTANRFSMSSLAVAAVDGDAGQSLPDLTKRAATLVDGLTNVGSQRNRKLISQLEKLGTTKKLSLNRLSQRVPKRMSRRSTPMSRRTSARIPRICPAHSAIPRSCPPFSAPHPS